MAKPVRHFSDWLDAYMEYTEMTESPASYRKWAGIGCIAAALQRKCWASWTLDVLYPNMYIILVGPSGLRKGTALSPALNLVKAVGLARSSNATTPQALVQEMRRAYKTIPLNNVPYEHSSITIFSKEFTVFLEYQNHTMLSMLCDWYDCDDDWYKDTVMRDVEPVIGVWVNLIAATTPQSLQLALPPDAIGGGFTSRAVFVCAKRKGQAISPFDKSPIEVTAAFRTKLVHDLEIIYHMAGQFRLSPAFVAAFEDWYFRESQKPASVEAKRFSGYESRRATHVMKLSMILSASRSGEMLIDLQDFARALSTLEATERHMGMVFQGYGMGRFSSIKKDVLQYIRQEAKKDPLKHVQPHKVARAFSDDLDASDLAEVLGSLAQEKYIEINEEERYFMYLGGADD